MVLWRAVFNSATQISYYVNFLGQSLVKLRFYTIALSVTNVAFNFSSFRIRCSLRIFFTPPFQPCRLRRTLRSPNGIFCEYPRILRVNFTYIRYAASLSSYPVVTVGRYVVCTDVPSFTKAHFRRHHVKNLLPHFFPY